MMSMMMAINLVISMNLVLMKHPLSMGMMIIAQTVVVSILSGSMYQNMWFSYILTLIMLGGMLILFMYMTSIASNEKFKTNWKLMTMSMLMMMMMLTMNKDYSKMIMNNETLAMNKNKMPMNILNKFINIPMNYTTFMLMLYLVMIMIATVKITNFKQGSMREMK